MKINISEILNKIDQNIDIIKISGFILWTIAIIFYVNRYAGIIYNSIN